MQIAINCRSFLTKQYTGIGRYAANLVHSLSKFDQTNNYVLYAPMRMFDRKRHAPKVDSENFHVKLDWFKRGPGKVLKKIDVYHSPNPDVIDFNHVKIVVTVHDLVYKAFPEGHTEQTIEMTDRQFRSFLPVASKIICCSQNTRNDLHQYFDINEAKTTVVHQGVDKTVFYPLNQEERQVAKGYLEIKNIEDPFILFVGTIEPRKNLHNLLIAFSQLLNKKLFKGKLVIAGMMGWKSEGIDDVIDKLELKYDVIFAGFVDNDELRYLYNEAEAFVFPSFYEGFGYPIIEAFSCGAAVVTSHAASCPEVAGDAAIIVDPQEPEKIAEGIAKIVNDPNMKEEFKRRALKRAKDFSFEKTAQETLEVYEEVHES